MSVGEVNDYIEQHTLMVPLETEGAQSVGFFAVELRSDPKVEDLVALLLGNELGEFDVRMTLETWKSGPQYIQLGGWLGSQESALRLIGLGGLLGLWTVGLPEMLGLFGPEAKNALGMGFCYAISNGRLEALAKTD